MDKLSEVIKRFSIAAGVFYSGQLCGISSFEEPNEQVGHLHLLRKGRMTVTDHLQQRTEIDQPALLFYPQPTPHRIQADASTETEIVCASVRYGTGAANPLATALPPLITLPLSDAPRLAMTANWLFEEAFADHDAKHIVMDRLAEILVVEVLRHLLQDGHQLTGMLAGLAHPQIGNALSALHTTPEHPWTLEQLAQRAAMSRSKFAALFKETVGTPAGDYLIDYRIEVSKGLLLAHKPVSWVANEVGYETASALARVFRKKLGVSPTEWLHQQVAA